MNLKSYKEKAAQILKSGTKELYVATFLLLVFTCYFTELLALFKIPEVVILIVALLILILQRGCSFALKKMYIRKRNGEEVTTFDFVNDGLNDMGRAWSITFSLIPKFILPTICILIFPIVSIYQAISLISDEPNFLVSGIVTFGSFIFYILGIILLIKKSYEYRYADFEAIMDPNATSSEVVQKTSEIMIGKRMKSFELDLYHIVEFLILYACCFGIGFVLGFITMFLAIIFRDTYLITSIGSLITGILVFIGVAVVQVRLLMAHIFFYEDLTSRNLEVEVKQDFVEELTAKSHDVIPDFLRERNEENNPFNSNRF